MSILWIVHRDPLLRAALARAAGAPEGAVRGAPGDPIFAEAARPDVILLGLSGDLEAELEFAHRTAMRAPDARWILVAERDLLAAARQRFDRIETAILPYPPAARELRTEIQRLVAAGPGRGAALPLSRRATRDVIAQRFARWFADLELPELMRALDPHLADVPLLILGEEGCGKGLLAHYVHVFGSDPESGFAHVACAAGMSLASLRRALTEAVGEATGRCTVWLEDVDALSPETQRQLARWIEFGPPPRVAPARIARWLGSGSGEAAAGSARALDPVLRSALGGLAMRVPTLRERPERIASFVKDTTLAWCSARRQRARHFAEDALSALTEYPWPHNLRELESVVIQTLAASGADLIRADDLQYDGGAFAPLDASEVGTLIETDVAGPAARREEAPREAAEARRSPDAGPARDEHAPAAARNGAPYASVSIQPLVAAIAHEIRNPVSTIRTFAELLPDRYDDPDFRMRFAELVGEDTQRIEAIVQRLTELADLEPPEIAEVDLSALLEELLGERTERMRDRHLLVLKELDDQHTTAIGDPGQLRLALAALIDKSLELAPEGGDVFIASRHHAAGLRGRPAVRVLVRFGNHDGALARSRVPGTSPAENALEYAIAAAIIRAQGGTFTIDLGEGNETVLLLDLPA